MHSASASTSGADARRAETGGTNSGTARRCERRELKQLHNPKTIEDVRLIFPRSSIPHYPEPASSTTPHSHSIVSEHRNALIFIRKSFLLTV